MKELQSLNLFASNTGEKIQKESTHIKWEGDLMAKDPTSKS
jgi:hypothetical protein